MLDLKSVGSIKANIFINHNKEKVFGNYSRDAELKFLKYSLICCYPKYTLLPNGNGSF